MATATSLTSAFNSVLTSHFRVWTTRDVIEQAYKGNVLLEKLQRTNDLPIVGNELHVPVTFVDEPLGDSMTGAQTLSTASVDPATIARYTCANYAEPLKLLWTDEREANGPDGVIRYAEMLAEQNMMRISVLMARDIAATTQGNTLDLLPLNVIAPASPTSTTLGSIAQASNTSWANQTQASFGSFSANFNKLETLSTDCQKYGQSDWDWGVCDTTTFLRFKKLARTYLSIQVPGNYRGTGTADLGMGGGRADIYFEGKPIVHDRHLSDTWTRRRSNGTSASVSGPASTNGVIFLVNNRALKLAVDKGAEFAMGEWANLAPGGQLGRICYRVWRGQLVCQERSALGRADGITA